MVPTTFPLTISEIATKNHHKKRDFKKWPLHCSSMYNAWHVIYYSHATHLFSPWQFKGLQPWRRYQLWPGRPVGSVRAQDTASAEISDVSGSALRQAPRPWWTECLLVLHRDWLPGVGLSVEIKQHGLPKTRTEWPSPHQHQRYGVHTHTHTQDRKSVV